MAKRRANTRRGRTLPTPVVKPVAAHIQELRWRLLKVLAWFGISCLIGLVLGDSVTAHAKDSYWAGVPAYLHTGITLTVPAVLYQILRFLEPVIRFQPNRAVIMPTLLASMVSLLSLTLFKHVEWLVLLHIPVVLLGLNRARPLRVHDLTGKLHIVVPAVFVAAAFITPTGSASGIFAPALHIMMFYAFGVGIIWLLNRRARVPIIDAMFERDEQLRSRRSQVHPARVSAAPAAAKADAPKVTEAVPEPHPAPAPPPKVSRRPTRLAAAAPTIRRTTYDSTRQIQRRISL